MMTAVASILRTAGHGYFADPVFPHLAHIMKRCLYPRRQFLASWLMFGALLLVASACGGDNAGPSGSGSLSARVDGSTWTANHGIGAARTNSFISIAGSVGATSNIAIAWPDEGTGTYTIPTPVGMNMNYGLYANGHVWQALAMGTQLGGLGTGSVTVTTLNAERVVGTFQFTAPAAASSGASGQKVVTNGVFDIKF